MKGITKSLMAMKIQLNPDVKLVKRRPYNLNPKYKDKEHKELDRILYVDIIVPLEESEWIIPMVVQPKNIGNIRIFFDLHNLNTAYVHDSFPTPFIDKILENASGHEVYSFIDGFYGYHQVWIVEEYQSKTTFSME